MKSKKFIILFLSLFLVTFFVNSCNKNSTVDKEGKGTKLEFGVGDLLAQTHYISGENTVWIFEYKSYPAVILEDIEKDGREYILVLQNGLTGARTKVAVKKGTVLDVKKSIPLDMDIFGTYEAIMGARGHIPNEMKVIDVSKTKLVVEVSQK